MSDDLTRLYEGQNAMVKFYVYARARLLKMDYFLQFLPHSGLIVDVGCGYGLLANYLSLNLPGNQVYGIDMNGKRIAVARQTIGKRSNINFAAGDAVKWAWPQCTAVVMTDFLHHVPRASHELILQSAYNNLQENGILLISEVDPTIKPAARYWQSYLSDRVLYPMSPSYFRKPAEMEAALSGMGFNVKINRPAGNFFAKIIYICRK